MQPRSSLLCMLALFIALLHHRLRFVSEASNDAWNGLYGVETIGELRSRLPYQGRLASAWLIVQARDVGLPVPTGLLLVRWASLWAALLGLTRLHGTRSAIMWIALLPLGATCTQTADTYPACAFLVWWLVAFYEGWQRWALVGLALAGALTRETIALGPAVVLVDAMIQKRATFHSTLLNNAPSITTIAIVRIIFWATFPGDIADSAWRFNIQHIGAEGRAVGAFRICIWVAPFALAALAWRRTSMSHRTLLLVGCAYAAALPFVARMNELRVLSEPWMLITPTLVLLTED